jgi:hypothetical protein
MKISYIQNKDIRSTETRITYNLIEKFKERGIEVLINECTSDCDFILCLNGLSQFPLFQSIKKDFPYIKSIMYVWDLYHWTQYTQGYNSIKNCDEVWTPSNEVILRLKEIYSVNKGKCKVIKCYTKFFDSNSTQIIKPEDKFIYHCVRDYNDPNHKFINRACDDLKLNLIRSHHNLSQEQYRDTILNCAFLVTEYREASTGGLTLLEGYYHGKNILLSDSKYQGGNDYFGDRAYYFKDGDFEDFKEKVQMLWDIKDEPVDLEDRRKFCKKYTIDAMVDRIINRLNKLK